MQEVIKTTGVLQYEQFGFTNCMRFKDILYLSGVSALDLHGKVVGGDIETQTIHTYQNIETILRAAGSGLDRILQMTSFVVDLESNGGRYVAARGGRAVHRFHQVASCGTVTRIPVARHPDPHAASIPAL